MNETAINYHCEPEFTVHFKTNKQTGLVRLPFLKTFFGRSKLNLSLKSNMSKSYLL